ncbi:MAG TPA: two-component regulator propeller domain-containing protein [Terracidiphilus sp.]|jgi:signal transduction histidine kinase/streptogramin lyase
MRLTYLGCLLGFSFCSWLIFLCVPLYGIDRDRKLAELYHTAWTFKEGAPSEVHALAQTTDGFLWLGTASGLFCFDGIRFQPFKPPSGQSFPQRNVVSLFAVPDGGLWVGYWYGGVSFIKGGTVTEYGKSDGLPSQAVWAFARDRQGVIWIAAGKGGLARLEGARWQKIGSDWGFADAADTVFVDHAGTVWVGTETSVEYLVEGGHQFQIAARGLVLVKNLAESSDGTLWMAEQGYGVRPVPLPGKRPGPAIFVGSQAITFDNQGSLWITTLGTGIRRVPSPGQLHQVQRRGPSAWQFHNSEVEAFTEEAGLTSDFMYCALQDREGNLWFGTSAGLDRFRQSSVVSVPLQPISYRGAPPIPSLHSFTTSALAVGDQGALWVAGMGPKLLLKIQNDKIVTQLRDRNVDSAYRDPEGVVWLATSWSKFCLADECLDSIGSKQGAPYNYHGAVPAGQGLILRQVDLPTGGEGTMSPRSFVKAVTQDRMGGLWVSMESGTFRLERSAWTSLNSLGGPQGTASAEFTDSKGRIWFGFTNTVAMLDGDKVSTFSSKDGVRVGAITSIQGQGTKIWIGGEFGLEYYDGSRFESIQPSDGSSFGGVSGIIADPEGELWFSDNRGIIHIRRAQLQQTGSGKVEFESFGLLDGLTAGLRGSLASPSAVRTADGRIWFATSKGVAWINPKRIVRNPVPPPVIIESVIANGREYDNSTDLKLPPRTANLQISYTATSLTIPQRVRFRYKLEGQDTDWQDAGTRREAFYTKLDPGSYQFRVIACNNDGVWNEAGTAIHFVVLPAFNQTITFKILCGLAALAALWLLYLLRLRQATAQIHQRLGARLEERERIARELHDTLLQSFQGLLLRFQAASNLLPNRPADAKKKLDHAITQTSQAIVEGRGAVQGLRSSPATSSDLADAIRMLGDELSASMPSAKVPGLDVVVEGVPRTLHPVVRDEVYRIAAEALRNAFHHAESDRIEVELHFDAIRLWLRIRDDGKGIEPRLLEDGGQAGHWGLQGMRERASIIGGKFEIWSDVRSGTEIELTLPSYVAYDEQDSRRSHDLQERTHE